MALPTNSRYIMVHGQSPMQPQIHSLGYIPAPLRPHMDDFYRTHAVVHFVLSGEGVYLGERVTAGQGFLVRSGTYDNHASTWENPWSYFWFEVEGEYAEALSEFLFVSSGGLFSFRLNEKTVELLTSFLDRERMTLTALEAQSFFAEFLNAAVARTREVSDGVAAAHYRNLCRYLFRHLKEPLRMTEVAASEHIDVQYMYNLFMRYAGLSPKKYLSALRLDRACALLRDSERTVSEIGSDCGYPDSLQFSKFFSGAVKMSPREYRRKCLAARPSMPPEMPDFLEDLPFGGGL